MNCLIDETTDACIILTCIKILNQNIHVYKILRVHLDQLQTMRISLHIFLSG